MVPDSKGAAQFQHVQSCESADGREIVEQFWQEAVSSRSEGLMIKVCAATPLAARRLADYSEQLLDSGVMTEDSKEGKSRRKLPPATYEPGTAALTSRLLRSLTDGISPDKRTAAWLKLKKDYVTGLGDSLDLVPVGAWHGNGRKAQWWSPILLAVWDPATGKLVAVCKCMSGRLSLHPDI